LKFESVLGTNILCYINFLARVMFFWSTGLSEALASKEPLDATLLPIILNPLLEVLAINV